MVKRQEGFSAIEGLLILVIVAIVGFTGWYVYNSQKKTNNSYNNAASANQHAGAAGAISGGAKKTTGQTAVTTNGGSASSCSLSLAVGQKTGAAGTFHESLIVTNTGTSSCTLNGYPTVTLVDANGKQIGSAAGHDTAVSASAVVLKPNDKANAGLSLPDYGVAPNCLGTKSAQIYVTGAGVTNTLKVADATEYYCPDFLTRPFQAGSGL